MNPEFPIRVQNADVELDYEWTDAEAVITIRKEGKVISKIRFKAYGEDDGSGYLSVLDETPESDFQRALKEDLPQIKFEEDRREATASVEDYSPEDDGQPSDLTEFQDLEGEDLPAEEH